MATAEAGPLDDLIPFNSDNPQPVTPQPPHATIDGLGADSKSQTALGDLTTTNMTPPPSTQINHAARAKDRTPTPTYSSISTPPPTLDLAAVQQNKLSTAYAASMSAEQIATASTEELRTTVRDLQAAYQEAKMNATHYKLQYQMLAQESEAAIERMDIEARMAQHENDVIQIAGQARATATPAQSISGQDGMIPVQKDLYQYMCQEIQQLHQTTDTLQRENIRQDRIIVQQEAEIESLSDRVSLMRDRIRSNREHLNHLRRPSALPENDFSRSAYTTPKRASGQDQFAALLQASEIARKEANPARKSSHSKSGNTLQHVTMTPQRYQKSQAIFATPGQSNARVTPATAPMPRVTNFRNQDGYAQPALKQPALASAASRRPPAPRSEDTVSNSDRDVDSEAETDIIEPDGPVKESQASIKASFMLRNSHEDDVDRRKAVPRSGKPRSEPKQTTLFGTVRKHGIDRDDGDRPNKKTRTGGIGLGIIGTRH